MTELQQTATDRLAAFEASQNPNCVACKQFAVLSPNMKCNAHRTVSMSEVLVLRAQVNGYTGSDPMEAERYLNATPVAAN